MVIGLPSKLGIRVNALPVGPAGKSQEEAARSGLEVLKGEQRCLRWRALEFRIQFFSKRILYADYFSLFRSRSRPPARHARVGAGRVHSTADRSRSCDNPGAGSGDAEHSAG